MMVHTNIYIHNYITYNRLVRQTMIQLYIASPLKTHIESPRNIISPHIFASFSIVFGRSTRIFVPSSTAMPTSSVAPASWTSWRRRPVKTHGFSEGFSKKTQSNEWYVQLFFWCWWRMAGHWKMVFDGVLTYIFFWLRLLQGTFLIFSQEKPYESTIHWYSQQRISTNSWLRVPSGKLT